MPDLTAAIREAMEALEPFAREADEWNEMSELRRFQSDFGPTPLTVADMRRARAALATLKEIIEGRRSGDRAVKVTITWDEPNA